MSSTDPRYSFDANVLIIIALERYPKDVFPSFWQQLTDFINAGRLKVIEFVWNEVKGNSGEDYKGLENSICIGIDSLPEDEQDAIQKLVSEILSTTPDMLNSKGRVKSGGDPWIIAHSKLHNLVVVTEEKRDSINKNKIPNICDQYGVKCIKLLDFLREIGWKM